MGHELRSSTCVLDMIPFHVQGQFSLSASLSLSISLSLSSLLFCVTHHPHQNTFMLLFSSFKKKKRPFLTLLPFQLLPYLTIVLYIKTLQKWSMWACFSSPSGQLCFESMQPGFSPTTPSTLLLTRWLVTSTLWNPAVSSPSPLLNLSDFWSHPSWNTFFTWLPACCICQVFLLHLKLLLFHLLCWLLLILPISYNWGVPGICSWIYSLPYLLAFIWCLIQFHRVKYHPQANSKMIHSAQIPTSFPKSTHQFIIFTYQFKICWYWPPDSYSQNLLLLQSFSLY